MKIKFKILQNVVIYMIKYVQQKKKLNLLIIENHYLINSLQYTQV